MRALVDATGAMPSGQMLSYDAFGVRTDAGAASSVLTPLQYAGEWLDQHLGQYYLRARYFMASTGRFSSFDAFEAGPRDPGALHKYGYANGNPVAWSDPSGLATLKEISGNIGLMLTKLSMQLPNLVSAGRAAYTTANLTLLRAYGIAYALGATRVGMGVIAGLEGLNVVGLWLASPIERQQAFGTDPFPADAGLQVLVGRSTALARRVLSPRKVPNPAEIRDELRALREALTDINSRAGAGRNVSRLSRKTIAAVYGEIDGVPIELVANSGERSIRGTVPTPRISQLDTDFIGEGVGDYDAERKIFEHLEQILQSNPRASGTLRLVIDHPQGGAACANCAAAIRDFQRRFNGRIVLEEPPLP